LVKRGLNKIPIISVAIAVIFGCSLFPLRNGYSLTDKGLQTLHNFAKVLHYIEDNYVTPVNEEELIHGAIRGMVGTLDPHSVYMSPDVYRELKVDTRGRFDGIGIEVSVRKGLLTVISPIKGTPADEVGIQARDQIIRINGKPTADLNLSEAVRMMRGKRGSRIKLTIKREGIKNPFDVTLTLRVIKVPSVKYDIYDDKFAYVTVINFQQGTGRALEKVLKEMHKKYDLQGLILDLRKNPGGLLDQAVAVSDIFLSHGKIVTTESRGTEIDRRDAHEGGTEPDYPIIVLVDGGSASAAEIVAGALQDNKRAIVVGTKSFGKGSVQTVIDLDDGAGLKLTIAYYLTPSGRIIQDHGIKPDIVVPSKPPKPKTVRGEGEEKPEPYKGDYQFEMALDYMRSHYGKMPRRTGVETKSTKFKKRRKVK